MSPSDRVAELCREAAGHLRQAEKALDDACRLDAATCECVEAIEGQDRITIIAGRVEDIARFVEGAGAPAIAAE